MKTWPIYQESVVGQFWPNYGKTEGHESIPAIFLTFCDQVIEGECAAVLHSFTPVGNGYKEIIPDALDFTVTEDAFRKSMGSDRTLISVKVIATILE